MAQADKVTSVGNVVLKPYQKLPSRLLGDLCKKNSKSLGRGMPIYRPVGNRGAGGAIGEGRGGGGGGGGGDGKAKYRYRLIIPDNSKKGSSDNDIVVVPALPVANDEQAKEEAALLGLLYLFPKLPHERTLPEPYRATLLAALKSSAGKSNEAANSSGSGKAAKTKGRKDEGASAVSNDSKKPIAAKQADGATANTQLAANLPSFGGKGKGTNHSSNAQQPLLTRAQINEAKKQHKREMQARIRKREAIRNANKPMEVFMSARFRKRIECLLSGDKFEDEDEDDASIGLDDNDEDVVRVYVRQRLVHEGFVPSHVNRAYQEAVVKKGMGNADDEQMDRAYEETLQYLCIHLKEDQLPLGFDPRGGTLDVVSAGGIGKKNGKNKQENGGKKDGDDAHGVNTLRFARYFGLGPKEAAAIYESNDSMTEELASKRIFWRVMAEAASLPIERTCFGSGTNQRTLCEEEKQRNEETAADEREALGAIYDEGDYAIRSEGSSTIVTIALPFDDVESNKLSLAVHYENGRYPDLLPLAFVTCGDWHGVHGAQQTKYRFGGTLHFKMAQYLSEMTPGQEVIFELFGHVQALLQEMEDESLDSGVSALMSHLKLDDRQAPEGTSNNKDTPQPSKAKGQTEDSKVRINQARKKTLTSSRHLRRPRERSTFWNTHPSKTRPAESYPKISTLLDRARKALPAAKARSNFLSLMDNAKKGERVVLVTGETGELNKVRGMHEYSSASYWLNYCLPLFFKDVAR